MPTLVYVHGRGQKQTAEREHEKWYLALQEGLRRLAPEPTPSIDRADVRLAYWSDLFYPPRRAAATRGSRAAAAGTGVSDERDEETRLAEIVARTYLEAHLPVRAAVAPEVGGAAPIPPPGRPASRGLAAGPAATTAAAPDVATYEDSFMQDVVKYFGLGFAEKVSRPLVEILSEEAFADGVMLVSHSFGTIVCFDVLARNLTDIDAARTSAGRDPLHIDTWLTLGCPLGWALDLEKALPAWLQMAAVQASELKDRVDEAIAGVQRRLQELGGWLRPGPATRGLEPGPFAQLGAKQFPPRGVDRWYNIYDPQDWVSFPPVVGALGIGAITVGDTFRWNGQQRAFDISIVNDFRTPGAPLLDMEAHNDRGYGQCAQTAQLVCDFWTRHQRP